MYHVFLDNVTKQTAGDVDLMTGVKRSVVVLTASLYAGDAGRVVVTITVGAAYVLVTCPGDLAPYISVDAQVLYAARLFGNLLP